MKKIAICDDNELQRQLLTELLAEYCRRIHQKIEIVEYNCGETLIADMEEEEFHAELLFLDINMPGMNGMETAKKLRTLNCDTEIVFLTITGEYALESYEVWAAGYLVKPISMGKLSSILHHVFGMELRKRIEIKTHKQYRYPYVSDIMYIEGSGHKATLHLTNGSQITTMEKISTLKEKMDDPHFHQCHQSYLVNMEYIADIQKEVILVDEKKIPISARRRTETIQVYHQFFEQMKI